MEQTSIMRYLTVLMLLLTAAVIPSWSQILPPEQLNTDDLTEELQLSPPHTPDDYFMLAWWVPYEWWASVFNDEDSEELLATMKPYTFLAVVCSDITSFGSFNYYPMADVVAGMTVQWQDAEGKRRPMVVVEDLPKDLKLLIDIMKPILAQALGGMGENLHFLVFSDETQYGTRLADPYADGALHVHFTDHKDREWEVSYPTPLNSLFKPRLCPNGKPAHVSWNYCPWTGEKLPPIKR